MIVNISYAFFFNIYLSYSKDFINIPLFFILIFGSIVLSFFEYNFEERISYFYQIKVIILIFLLNLMILSSLSALIITIISYFLYLFERNIGLIILYDEFSGKQKIQIKNFLYMFVILQF